MTDRERLIAMMDAAREYADFECDKRDGCSCCPNDSRDEFCLTPDMVDHLIANGVTVQRWIPVTERLPEHKQLVFVTDTDGSVFSTLFYSEEYFRRNYTHWMPLPEPPKEGE